MLVVQLRNSKRPIAYGEFTPRLPSREGRAGSASARLCETGRVGQPASHNAWRRSGSAATSRPSRVDSPFGVEYDHDMPRAPSASSSSKLVKEYKVFSNKNSYHGTWLDRRMHGEGVYTWSDGGEYRGQFYQGYMWGRGEKRWPNGRVHSGEWVRDMMWGVGELTWPSGEKFKGQFRKGIFHGKGTRVWPSGDRYAGEFKNGEQEGEGTFESAAEGWVYEGHWLQGRMCGEGHVEWPNKITYEGEWKDGIREGHGRLAWPDGSWYEGQFRHNRIEGRGRKELPDGSWFAGHFHDGELEGHGTVHWPDGTEFEGLWHKSEVVGPGCHRFPDDTMIIGVFEDRGASGEGTKRWANGCTYQGKLHQNHIEHYGNLKWPDGRCYVGHFQDEAMNGEGMLTWYDTEGLCQYKGSFANNAFHGEGVLKWSNKAKYTGQFCHGFYHGEGKFEWPDRLSIYSGQWENGDMCGRGTLAVAGDTGGALKGDPYVYIGQFVQGHLKGTGKATFLLTNGQQDQYKGELHNSKFHGLGTFTWASGHSLSGHFHANRCNGVGCKRHPGGQTYYGELKHDFEHGKGVLVDCNQRLIGLWHEGRCMQELFELCVPALELDAIAGEDWQKVFGGIRESQKSEVCDPAFLSRAETGEFMEGEAIVLFRNGDKYIGHAKAGKKDGQGMYVYADLTAYKGQWDRDIIHGLRHPLAPDVCPSEVAKLHNLNEENQNVVEELKAFTTTTTTATTTTTTTTTTATTTTTTTTTTIATTNQ